MKTYIIRRLLLMPLTLIGVTFLVFCVTRFVPGGPVDQMMQEQTMGALSGEKATAQGDSNISEEDLERLEEQFNLQERTGIAYLQWLGIMPKKTLISKAELPSGGNETVLTLSDSGRFVRLAKPEEGTSPRLLEYQNGDASEPTREGWMFALETPRDRAERWAKRLDKTDETAIADKAAGYRWRAVAWKEDYDGILQGSFGNSFKYNEPVWDMIAERIPVSLYFGILSAIITYAVSLPLGIMKAIRHKTWFDNITSVLIFLGYAVPGFALGAVLVVYFGARLEWFPLCGLTSVGFEHMGFWAQVRDLAHHTVLPLVCYVISTFAVTTMMMKNNLMENLSSDYIRTAMAKGVTFRQAVYGHAFRNSFIPLATTLGTLVSTIIAGSMLIERVFDIQGFGMLSYQALMDKDYSLIMASLLLTSFFMMLGNLLADIVVACVDPRVKFD